MSNFFSRLSARNFRSDQPVAMIDPRQQTIARLTAGTSGPVYTPTVAAVTEPAMIASTRGLGRDFTLPGATGIGGNPSLAQLEKATQQSIPNSRAYPARSWTTPALSGHGFETSPYDFVGSTRNVR